MSEKSKIFYPSVRKRKAYWTAFIVFWSYYVLHLKSKVFGKAYFDKRVKKLHEKNATLIKNRVQELQGLFIKFGQLISNLSNALPQEFRGPLEELQDHIRAKPFAEIRQTIKEELGDYPDKLFTSFDKNALAAASIGQVHRARIGKEDVVVKIQHANIQVIARADLEILKNLVKIHAFFMDMKGLDHMYEQVRQVIEEELDYTQEAESMRAIAKNLKSVPELRVKIPRVFPKYSSSKILVSSFCEGTKIGHLDEIKSWDLNLEDLAKRLIELYCKMVLVDGFYHADPHPGNILVNKKGELILLDFGAVAHLNPNMKKAIPELIEAVIKNDTEATVAALRKMGFLGSDKESEKYVEKIIGIFRKFLQDEVQLDGLNFQNIKLNSGLSSLTSIIKAVDLRDVSNTIHIPKDYILLNRTIVLLIGNIFHLAPQMNALNVVRPYAQKHILGKDGGFTQLIVNTFKNQITTAISLPNELSQFLKTANKGELEYEVKGLEDGFKKMYNLGQQFLFSILLIIAIYFKLNYFIDENSFWWWINWVIIGIFGVLFLKVLLKRE
jgi:ubiquinone biosynthesis protein